MGAFERHINTKQLYGGKALHIPACRSALMIMYGLTKQQSYWRQTNIQTFQRVWWAI